MGIGDVVSIKQYSNMLGVVTAIDDNDKVTIRMCDTGLALTVAMCELSVTGGTQPYRDRETSVMILGTKYKILIIDKQDYRYSKEEDGWCDYTSKEILLFNYRQSFESVKDLIAYQRKVLRHEIIHAFLYESGLSVCAGECECWAKNEEMVDWLAIQEPKIHKAFMDACCAEPLYKMYT